MNKENSEFVKIQGIGQLYFKDIIIFYDEPLLFSCQTISGHLYLVNCLSITETTKEWLLSPISESRLIKGLKGNISAYDLFHHPEDEFLLSFKESIDMPIEEYISSSILPESLGEEYYPSKDIYFNFLQDTFLPECTNSIETEAVKENRHVLDLSLQLRDTKIHEMPANLIASIVQKFYKSYKDFYLMVSGQKRFSPNLIYAGSMASSLKLRFKSDEVCIFDEFDYPNLTLELMLDLISSKNDKNNLSQLLNKIPANVCLHFLKFLKIIEAGEIGIEATLATPGKQVKNAELNFKEVLPFIELLNSEIDNKEEIIVIQGEIIAYDSSKQSFVILHLDEIQNIQEIFKGTISSELGTPNITIPSPIKVTIKQKIKINRLMNAEEVENILTTIHDKIE